MTIDDLTNAAIERLRRGLEGPASTLLPGTDRRDELTAESRESDSGRFGRTVRTVYRLNGDRLGHRAAELLLMAYGAGSESRS